MFVLFKTESLFFLFVILRKSRETLAVFLVYLVKKTSSYPVGHIYKKWTISKVLIHLKLEKIKSIIKCFLSFFMNLKI